MIGADRTRKPTAIEQTISVMGNKHAKRLIIGVSVYPCSDREQGKSRGRLLHCIRQDLIQTQITSFDSDLSVA